MGATYRPDDITGRNPRLDVARFLLGDRDSDGSPAGTVVDPLLADEEILDNLQLFGWKQGMIILANGLIAQFAQEVSKVTEAAGASYEWSKRLDGWAELIKNLKGGQLPDPSDPGTTTYGTVGLSSYGGVRTVF